MAFARRSTCASAATIRPRKTSASFWRGLPDIAAGRSFTTYEDQGISGAKGRDQRPAFDQMLKDAVRRRFDILLVWSIDRLGRSVLHVANALAELDAAGIRLYCDQQGIDSSTPMGRAMIQMASIFGEQERSILRDRVIAGLDRVRQQGKRLGRPKVPPKVEQAIRTHLRAGNGILKVGQDGRLR